MEISKPNLSLEEKKAQAKSYKEALARMEREIEEEEHREINQLLQLWQKRLKKHEIINAGKHEQKATFRLSILPYPLSDPIKGQTNEWMTDVMATNEPWTYARYMKTRKGSLENLLFESSSLEDLLPPDGRAGFRVLIRHNFIFEIVVGNEEERKSRQTEIKQLEARIELLKKAEKGITSSFRWIAHKSFSEKTDDPQELEFIYSSIDSLTDNFLQSCNPCVSFSSKSKV